MASDVWKSKCQLLKETVGEDTMHRPTKSLELFRIVYCKCTGVKQNEFYQAAAQGYKVELTLEIRCANYDPSITHLRYNGKLHRILRTYPAKCSENLVIVCADKVVGGDNGELEI